MHSLIVTCQAMFSGYSWEACSLIGRETEEEYILVRGEVEEGTGRSGGGKLQSEMNERIIERKRDYLLSKNMYVTKHRIFT